VTAPRTAADQAANLKLHSLQRQQAQRQVADPIWATPIPETPDWDHLDDHQQHVYKLAVIAYAIRAISDSRGVSVARQLADWEVI